MYNLYLNMDYKIENTIYLGFNINITDSYNGYYKHDFNLINKKDDIKIYKNLSNTFEENFKKILNFLKEENYLMGTTWFIDECNYRVVDFYENFLNLINENHGEIGLLISTQNNHINNFSNVIETDKIKKSYERLEFFCKKKNTFVSSIKLKNLDIKDISLNFSGYAMIYDSEFKDDQESFIYVKNNNIIIKEIKPIKIIDTILKINKKNKNIPIFLRIELLLSNYEEIIRSLKNCLMCASKLKINFKILNCHEMIKTYSMYEKKNFTLIPISKNLYGHLSESVIYYNIINDKDISVLLNDNEIEIKYVSEKPFSSSGISFIIKPEILKNIYETNSVIIKFYAKSTSGNILKFFTGKNFVYFTKITDEYKLFEIKSELYISPGHSIFRFNLDNPKKNSVFYIKDIEFISYSPQIS